MNQEPHPADFFKDRISHWVDEIEWFTQTKSSDPRRVIAACSGSAVPESTS